MLQNKWPLEDNKDSTLNICILIHLLCLYIVLFKQYYIAYEGF